MWVFQQFYGTDEFHTKGQFEWQKIKVGVKCKFKIDHNLSYCTDAGVKRLYVVVVQYDKKPQNFSGHCEATFTLKPLLKRMLDSLA